MKSAQADENDARAAQPDRVLMPATFISSIRAAIDAEPKGRAAQAGGSNP